MSQPGFSMGFPLDSHSCCRDPTGNDTACPRSSEPSPRAHKRPDSQIIWQHPLSLKVSMCSMTAEMPPSHREPPWICSQQSPEPGCAILMPW